MRLRELYGADLPERVDDWLEALLERPSVGRELEVVKGLTEKPRLKLEDMSDIDLEELSGRLGEVPVIDVRRPEEYDGTFGARAIRGRATFPERSISASTR